jgi:hypothetical protein
MLKTYWQRVVAIVGLVFFGAFSLLNSASNVFGVIQFASNPEAKLSEAQQVFAWLMTTPWWVPTLITVAFAGWLFYITRPTRIPPITPPKAADTKIRLYFDSNSQVTERGVANIWRWRAETIALHLMSLKTGDPAGTAEFCCIFLVFTEPVQVRQIVVSAVTPLPQYEVRDFSERSAVILFHKALRNTEVSIQVQFHESS